MTERLSRRRLLASIGLAAVPFAGCGGSRGAWVPADAPTDAGLYDVVSSREGAYAVGEAGVVLHRDEDEWSIAVENGPAGAGNGLRSADVTNNGRAVWFCGDSGAVGLYDTVAEHLADFSAPREKTSSWEAVAVSGLAGNERISLLNGSGELLRGVRDGSTVDWIDVAKPGTGSSVTAIDVTPLEYAYVCDTDGGVYESSDAGETWTRIGIDGAGVDFADVAAIDSGHVTVSGGNGVVYTYNGLDWSRKTVGEEPIAALARSQYDALAVSAPGAVYEHTFDGWVELDRIETGNDLRSVALGTARTPQLVVGESGTILERRY